MDYMDSNFALTKPESTGWGNYAAISAIGEKWECMAEGLHLDIVNRREQVITECAYKKGASLVCRKRKCTIGAWHIARLSFATS